MPDQDQSENERESAVGADGVWVSLADFRFLFPDSYSEIRRAETPPLHRLQALASEDVAFGAMVLQGAGSDAEASRYLSEKVASWDAEEQHLMHLQLSDSDFAGYRSLRCGAFDVEPLSEDGESPVMVETFAAAIGPDLLAFHIIYFRDCSANNTLRSLCTGLVEQAVARRRACQPELFS